MVKKQVIREIESLPTEFYSETMLLSEKSLAETWNTPEEDTAWADL